MFRFRIRIRFRFRFRILIQIQIQMLSQDWFLSQDQMVLVDPARIFQRGHGMLGKPPSFLLICIQVE